MNNTDLSQSEGNVVYDYLNEIKKLKSLLSQAEQEAARKDQQISQLTARMREYEMGEYGLTEAVSEIKDCKKTIKLQNREIEMLTEELNMFKLQVSEQLEETQKVKLKPRATTLEYDKPLENQGLLTIDEKFKSHVKKKKDKTRPQKLNKSSQCCISALTPTYFEELCTTSIQNEKLRKELQKICEAAIISSKELQKQHRMDCLKSDESIKILQENLEKMKKSSFTGNLRGLQKLNIFPNKPFDFNLDYYEILLNYISKEDTKVQEICHELLNQIHILKSNQNILIRRYIALSDNETHLRDENQKLKKALLVNEQKFLKTFNDKNYQILNDGFKFQYDSQNTSMLPSNIFKCLEVSGGTTDDSIYLSDHASISKLMDLEMKLIDEISSLKKLLEISHNQTQAMEAICFAQELEIQALKNQFALFQVQSDERMLLGKLAMKVLELQFNNAACIYELKRYKEDKETVEKWYSALRKEHEENSAKFSDFCLEAQGKVKTLCDVLKDICHRCTEALSFFSD